MKNKSQAFLEFQDIDSSKTMINYFTYVKPVIRNQEVNKLKEKIFISERSNIHFYLYQDLF